MKKILLITSAILLLAAACNKQVAIQPAPTPTPATQNNSTAQTANWKIYTNTRYGYSINYPSDWFMDTTYSEQDFTPRGSDNQLMGGDTSWGNDKNFIGSNAQTQLRSDFQSVYLRIYKVNSQTSLQDFVKSQHLISDNIQNVSINGISGLRLSGKDPENSSITLTSVVLNNNNEIFYFTFDRNSEPSLQIMDQMLATFKFSK